jgi:hypothetical protein
MLLKEFLDSERSVPNTIIIPLCMNDAFSLMRSLFDNQQGCDFYCIIYYTFLLFTTAKQEDAFFKGGKFPKQN